MKTYEVALRATVTAVISVDAETMAEAASNAIAADCDGLWSDACNVEIEYCEEMED